MSKDMIKQHLTLLGLDMRIAANIQKTINTWRDSSGPLYAINRLKDLKLMLLIILQGDDINFREFPWFKHRDGIPSGVFRSFFKNKNRHHLRISLSIVNTYHTMTLTEKQFHDKVQDTISNITAPYQGTQDYPEGFKPFKIREESKECFDIKPSFACVSTSKPRGKTDHGHPWFDSITDTSLINLPYQKFLDSSPIKACLDGVEQPEDYPGGAITFLHEPGGKCRPVLSPLAELQVVFREFHIRLSYLLKSISEDCTNDQESGARWAQNKLFNKQVVYSIDLKSATDRFPRWLQLRFLKESGFSSSWLSAFEATCQMPFKAEDKSIHYAVGQPMGLYGSFDLLALGQHGLILMAGYNLGISTKNQYRVLGDDVMIANTLLAREYLRLLSLYDIPISVDKTITSNVLAEFAGFIITPTSINKGVKPKSGSNLYSIDSLLNYSKALGFVPRRISRHVKKLIFPLVYSKEENGGLGFNPYGLSHEERDLWYDPTYVDDRLQNRILKSINTLVSKSLRYTIEFLSNCNSDIFGPYVDSLEMSIKKALVFNNMDFLVPLGVSNYEHLMNSDIFIGLLPTNVKKNLNKDSIKYIRDKYPYYFMQVETN